MGTFALPAISWLKAKPFELDRLEFGFRQEGFDLAGALGRLCVLQAPQALVDDVTREGRVLVSPLEDAILFALQVYAVEARCIKIKVLRA